MSTQRNCPICSRWAAVVSAAATSPATPHCALFGLNPRVAKTFFDLFYAAHKVHGSTSTAAGSRFAASCRQKFSNCSEDCTFCHAQKCPLRHQRHAASDDGRRRGERCLTMPVLRDRGALAAASSTLAAARRSAVAEDRGSRPRDERSRQHLPFLRRSARSAEEQALDLKNAGIRRVRHNLETSRKVLSKIVTACTWQGTSRHGCGCARKSAWKRAAAASSSAWEKRLKIASVSHSASRS